MENEKENNLENEKKITMEKTKGILYIIISEDQIHTPPYSSGFFRSNYDFILFKA